jgi:hypothetical protein
MGDSGLDWMIFGGAAASCYGSGREIRDIDVLADAPALAVRTAFSGFPQDRQGRSHASVTPDIEIWPAPLVFETEEGTFAVGVDREMLRHRRFMRLPISRMQLPIMSPEDVIVIKAIQQRGAAEGKHDLQDIHDMWAAQSAALDYEYLRLRAARAGASGRVSRALRGLWPS